MRTQTRPCRKHGELVARALHGIAAGVKVLEIPGVPEHGDVSDWLQAGGTRADLEAMVTTAPLWEPTVAKAATSIPPDANADHQGPYQSTSEGLLWWKESKYGPVAVPLTNFTARIVADVVEDDGAEPCRYFELEACHEGRTTRFPVEARHFAGMTWAMEHLGARALVMPGMMLKDHARAAVQLFSQNVETRHIYTHLGWRKIDETWCYLHADGAIGPHGPVSEVDVDVRHTLAAYVLPGRSTDEAQRVAVRASLCTLDTAADVVTIPLYAAIWRAVLGNADFSLHLVGPTGAGKSELAALAQQHYGRGMTARHLPAAWTSTGNALEGLAFEAKDVLLVVDDFCPIGSQTDIQRFHKDADRLLRAQGNRSGRQRMRFDGTLRPVKAPRGLIVSTGEDTPAGQSLRARVLILDVAPGSVHWDIVTACQQDAAEGTYTTALAGFVQWLSLHYEDVSQGLQTEITVLRRDGEDEDDDTHGHAPPSPTPTEQQALLEALLTQAGWRFSITTTADSFTSAFRSGGYAASLVLASWIKLAEPVQDELREAVYRDAGLLVAGVHDARNGRLDTPLGITVHGTMPHAARLLLLASPLHPAGEAPLAFPDAVRPRIDQAACPGCSRPGYLVAKARWVGLPYPGQSRSHDQGRAGHHRVDYRSKRQRVCAGRR